MLNLAIGGSDWLGDLNVDECVETLINGGTITITDKFADYELDYYGKLHHKWNGESMEYEVTLADINNGLAEIVKNDILSESRDYKAGCLQLLIDGYAYGSDADTLLQVIVFGDIEYI